MIDTLMANLPKGRAWEPQPRQEVLLRCPADERMFGGAKGGGKTDGGLGDWLLQLDLAQRVGSSARGIFFRQSYPELESVIERSRQIYPQIGGKWNETKKTWSFGRFGKLLMRFLEKDQDVMKYQGHSYDWINFDELGNYSTPYCYNNMLSCLRSAQGVPARLMSTGNPGGPGQGWVKRRFISGKKPDYIYTYKQTVILAGKETEVEMSRCFIPSFVTDNKYWAENDPGYFARLALLPDHIRRAYLDGDWDVNIGQAFGEIADIHKVDPFLVPYDWPKFATLDWGYVKPYSLGIWAVAPYGTLYRIAEDYGCVPGLENEGVKMDAKSAARRFVKILVPLGIDRVYADPACWQRQGHGGTIASMMDEVGLRLIPADRDRRTSKQTFHAMLQSRNDYGLPGIQISSVCEDWWRTVPNLTSDRNNLEDVDTKAEDHIYDDTRFAVMAPEVYRSGKEGRPGRRAGGKWMREDTDYAR